MAKEQPANNENQQEPEELNLARDLRYQKIYGTNVLCYSTDVDIRIEIMNEKIPDREGNWVYMSEGLVILTPQAAKVLKEHLEETIKKREETSGKIAIASERRLKVDDFGPSPVDG